MLRSKNLRLCWITRVQNRIKDLEKPEWKLPEGGVLHQVLDEGFIQKFCEKRWHGDSIPGQFDSGLEQLGPGQLAVLSVKGLVASQLTGNTNPVSACERKTLDIVTVWGKEKREETTWLKNIVMTPPTCAYSELCGAVI